MPPKEIKHSGGRELRPDPGSGKIQIGVRRAPSLDARLRMLLQLVRE